MSTKEKVLESLLASWKGGSDSEVFLSGENLASQCGISRTSVWKAIQSLERDGYCIEAISKQGYRLIALPDLLDAVAIEGGIRAAGICPGLVEAFSTIDSTNSEVKRREATCGGFRLADGSLTAAGEKLHRSLIVAGEQTAGRGRLGRTFVSPANSGVYFTLVYAPKAGVKEPALLTAAAAVAVCRAVEALYGVRGEIKWVNDVFAGGKKVCGILTEGFLSVERGLVEAVNVGIGINLRPAHFGNYGTHLAKTAGSLYEAAGCTRAAAAISRNLLVARVMSELLALYDAWEGGEPVQPMMAEYRARSLLLGKVVQVHPLAAGDSAAAYSGTVLDVDDSASLIVQTESGERRALHSGEVSLHSYDFAL